MGIFEKISNTYNTTYNRNAAKECCENLLASGDHSALSQMFKAIYSHKKERETTGKRLHVMDEHFFKDVEQILYNDFPHELNLSGKDVLMRYILERIGR